MGFFEEPIRVEMETNAQPAILHLMRNYCPGHDESVALMEMGDVCLRLNSKDLEVREAHERLGTVCASPTHAPVPISNGWSLGDGPLVLRWTSP